MIDWFQVRNKYMKLNLELLGLSPGSKEKIFTNSRFFRDGSNVALPPPPDKGAKKILQRALTHFWPQLTAVGPEPPEVGRSKQGPENE